jgi:hypothetical protein
MIRLVVLAAMALALSWSPAEARCRRPVVRYLYGALLSQVGSSLRAGATLGARRDQRRWAQIAIVVWPHHVGLIVGIESKSGLWMVHSERWCLHSNPGAIVARRYRERRPLRRGVIVPCRWPASGQVA